MALSLTEKQHWKNRVESKLRNRIVELRDSEPELLTRFREGAQKDTLAGLEHDLSRLDELEGLQVSINEALEKLLGEIYHKITGREADRTLNRWMIEDELSDLQEKRFEEFLRDHEIGQRIAKIEQRREELVDEILLATNIQQIIDVWEEVTSSQIDKPQEPQQHSLFAEAA